MNPLILDDINSNFDSPVIVALDYDNEIDAINLVNKLDPKLCKLKVGKELFTSSGPRFVEKLVQSGYKVFLDLKFHDIPHTVYKACKAASNLGVWMIDVHASGGAKMLEMARNAINEGEHKPLLIAITVLTSMDQHSLLEIGVNTDINKHIINLAKLSYNAGLDGVVCSPHEAQLIKKNTNDSFLAITPGIRLTTEKVDDQMRIMTPKLAKANFADYLVIGRPITKAADPLAELTNILSSINS